MFLKSLAITSVLAINSLKPIKSIIGEPLPLRAEKEIRYLDLPEDIPRIFIVNENYYMFDFQLPDEIEVSLKRIMNTMAWHSKVRRSLTEEDWLLIVTDENPKETFALKIRLLELKYSILKHKL